MESSAVARYNTRKSKKRVFSGSSSSCAEAEVMEIDPLLADRSSKRKSKGKQKEVASHEIIDLDMYEGKVESRNRKKGSSAEKKHWSPCWNWLPDIAVPFVSSNAHLEASLSQPNRVDPLSASSLFSWSKKNIAVFGHSSYFDPKNVTAQTVHSNFTKTGSGNYLSNNSNTLTGNGTSSYPHLELNKAYTSAGLLSGQDATVNSEVLKRYESFKRFDTVGDHSGHHYVNLRSFVQPPPKDWAKKIQEEWKILEKDLPDTIFVRVYESRMDLLRAVIIGAEGTPYHDGLFFFDVCLPVDYPNSPPLVHYHSGGVRINPNLYGCGKVCLSLLNTWSGGRKEKWIPGTSTMLQVLVSIQGLILNMKPYFNEPGCEGSIGSAYGEKASLAYNENTLILSLKTMVYTMKSPPKHFEDLVIGHFLLRERDILMACKAYTEGVQVGCLAKGGVQDVDECSNSCSAQFKQNVGSYINTLIAEFKKLGSKEAHDFLSSSVK